MVDQRDRIAQSPELRNDLGAVGGVLLHQLILLLGQFRRLRQDRVRHGKLADVVEESSVADRIELAPFDSELQRNGEGDLLDALRMARCVRVTCVDRRIQSRDRLERVLLEHRVGLA